MNNLLNIVSFEIRLEAQIVKSFLHFILFFPNALYSYH